MLTFMFSLIVPEEMAYISFFEPNFICCKVTDPLETVPWLQSAFAKTIKLLISCLESNPIWVYQVEYFNFKTLIKLAKIRVSQELV